MFFAVKKSLTLTGAGAVRTLCVQLYPTHHPTSKQLLDRSLKRQASNATMPTTSTNTNTILQKDDDVCRWLYNWYQIDTVDTRRFVLQFLPLILWPYTQSVNSNTTLPGACLVALSLYCLFMHTQTLSAINFSGVI